MQNTRWSPLKDKVVWADIAVQDIFEGDKTLMNWWTSGKV